MIDLRSLTLYTKLPELWEMFQSILAISPTNETGFTLQGADAFLNGYNLEALQITHRDFWMCMVYFLSRTNSKFLERKKASLAKNKRSR